MKYCLKNDDIIVELDSKGAELLSIRDKKGMDYLWNGDPTYWARRAPILFPFIGRLKNSSYTYKGKKYQSEPHGFARDTEFELLQSSETELWFEMRDSEASYEVYPFHFSLQIGYRLSGKTIEVSWRVKNLDKREPMFFSIGAHPGFLCPIFEEGLDKEGYYLELKGKRDRLIYQFANYQTGLLIKDKKELILENERIRLTKDFFDESTYLFLDHQVNEVSLVTPSGKRYVSVDFSMPILAIWSPEKLNAPFICLEPWCGCCDGEWFEGSLEEREWGNSLAPLQVFTNSYRIKLY